MTEETIQATEGAPAPVVDAPEVDKPVIERAPDGKFKNSAQDRIDELTRSRREAEREAAYWQQRAQTREAQDTAKAAPVKPTPEQFTDYNEYVEKLADFKADEKVTSALKADREETAKRQAQEKLVSTWKERETQARTVYSDYDQVMKTSDVQVLPHVIAALNDSDQGPALAYHLAMNPEVAERLNKLGEVGAAREIGRLEVALSKPVDKAPEETEVEVDPTPVRKTTSAPPPAKPLSSGRSIAVNMEKASMDDYVKMRSAQKARWAR